MGSRVWHSEVTLGGCCVVAEVTAVSGRCQDFGKSSRGGGLKKWKPEKLTVCPLVRFLGFQNCRFSPAQTYPKSCRQVPVGGGE